MDTKYRDFMLKNGQSHILKWYDRLKVAQTREIVKEQCKFLYDNEEIFDKMKYNLVGGDFDLSSVEKICFNDLSNKEQNFYQFIGRRFLNSFVFITYNNDIEINESVKEKISFMVKKMKYLNKKNRVEIKWYIMCTKYNFQNVFENFQKNNFFGYNFQNIKFFFQDETPIVNKSGEIYINITGELALTANGAGGVFYALKKNQILDEFKEKGVEWIGIQPLDNPLPIESFSLGYCIHEKIPCSLITTLFGNKRYFSYIFSLKMAKKISECNLGLRRRFIKQSYIDKNMHINFPNNQNAYQYTHNLSDIFSILKNKVVIDIKMKNS